MALRALVSARLIFAGSMLMCPPAALAQSQSHAQAQSDPAPAKPTEASLAEIARQNRAKRQGSAVPGKAGDGKAADGAAKQTFSNDQVERPGERRRVSLAELMEEMEETEKAAVKARTERAKEKREAAEHESRPAERGSERRAYPRQEQDPEYYRLRLQPLREELAQVESDLRSVRNNSTYDYRTDSVVSHSDRNSRTPTISNTIKNKIDSLESKKRDLQKRIAEIEEEAARNGVNLYRNY